MGKKITTKYYEDYMGKKYVVREIPFPETDSDTHSPYVVAEEGLADAFQECYGHDAEILEMQIDEYMDKFALENWCDDDIIVVLAYRTGTVADLTDMLGEETFMQMRHDFIVQQVLAQLVNMYTNNIIKGNGSESFAGWCADGEVFELNGLPKELVEECMDMVERMTPLVDELTYSFLNLGW